MDNQFQPLVFDHIELVEVPITIVGKSYVIREATAGAAAEWRSAAARCAKMTEGQLSSIDGIGSIEPLLVSLCLFQVNDEGFRVPVGIEIIKKWPAKVIKPMFDLAKKLSDLDDSETEESLNKQIASAQRRLEKLKGPTKEEQAKN